MSRSLARGFPWATVVGTFGLGCLAAGLIPGCTGEDALSSASGYPGDAGMGTGMAPPSGPCTTGSTQKCGSMLGAHGSTVTCFEGVNECIDGRWTGCRNGTEVERPMPPAPGTPGAKTLSLSQAAACGNNPCDPNCQQWIEKPDGGVNVNYEGSIPVIPDGGLPYPWTQGSYTNYPPDLGRTQPCTTASDCQIDTHCVSPSAGSCAHSQCETGAALASSCNACVTAICAVAPTCCSGSWTQACVDDVATVCGAECNAGANPGDPPQTAGTCEPWYGGQSDPTCAGYDLTVGPTCTNGIPVCNRGQGFTPRPLNVSIYPASQFGVANPTGASATCTIAQGIPPGWCTTVTGCGTPAAGDAIHVEDPEATAVDGGLGPQCRTDNDWSIYEPGACTAPICSSNGSTASTKPVNLFFMVDRSESMVSDTPSRWFSVTTALKAFFGDPNSAGINIAMRFFPDSDGVNGCDGAQANGSCLSPPGGPKCNVDACATPLLEGMLDWPVGTPATPCSASPDPTECSAFGALTTTQPVSIYCYNTPIHPALSGAIQWATNGKAARPTEEFAVVLVTDGDPTGVCDNTMADIDAVAAAGLAAGVRTYVVGIAGSGGITPANCTEMATAGGGQCFALTSAGGNVAGQAAAAFQSIAAKTTACSFDLPNQGNFDPNLASVTYTPGASPPSFTPACRPDETANGGACYYYLSTAYDWSTARNICRSFGNGWHIADIGDSTENTFVKTLAGGNTVWLSGEDQSREGTWTWWNGSPITAGVSTTPYANWGFGLPDGGTFANCLVMTSTGTWDDNSCTSTRRAVCEGPKEGDPSTPACTAGQTVGPDGQCYLVDTTLRTWDQALANCQGLGMDLADITSTALDLFVSKQLGGSDAWINLRNYSGAWKLGSGTTIYNSIGTSCRTGEIGYGGVCYKLTASGSWATAQSACQSLGTGFDLVRVDDGAENTFVQGQLGNTDTWIGANDRATEGTWRWPDNNQFFAGRACRSDETPLSGVCYYLGPPDNWSDAKSACSARGGKLVEIDGAAKNSNVKAVLGSATSAWIGATDAATEGKWVWASTNQQFWYGLGPAKSCPAGTQTNPSTGTCYTNNGGGSLDWFGAQTACRGVTSGSLSWDLTTVSSDAENAWVVATFPPTVATWIGGYRNLCSCTSATQRWSPPYPAWSDGSAWSYTHWGSGQPDTVSNCPSPPSPSLRETRVELLPDGTWNDDCSNEAFPYVCEAQVQGPIDGLYNDFATTPTAQPSVGDANDCGAMAADGTWSDQDCTTSRAYVCETPQGAAVGGLFNAWATSQPTANASGADCGVMSASAGTWSDVACDSPNRPGVCEGPQYGGMGPVSGTYNDWQSGNPTSTQAVARLSPGNSSHWLGSSLTATYQSVCVGAPATNSVPSALTPVSGASACSTNGQFYFDDPAAPTTLTLCTKACKAVQADRHARLDVQAQCKPTQTVPTPPGFPRPVTTEYFQHYEPDCPSGQGPLWQFLAYRSTTPGNSTIDIDARVGKDATDLAAAPWKPLTSVSAASNNEVCQMTDPCLVSVFSELGSPDDKSLQLDLRFTLHPGTNAEVPEVFDWRLTHTCVDNQ